MPPSAGPPKDGPSTQLWVYRSAVKVCGFVLSLFGENRQLPVLLLWDCCSVVNMLFTQESCLSEPAGSLTPCRLGN